MKFVDGGETTRRHALRTIALTALGASAAPAWVRELSETALAYSSTTAQVAASWTPRFLSPRQANLVAHMAELIIPQTETAGAKAAHVHEFIDRVLDDAREAQRRPFLQGLDWMDTRSYELFGADFMSATNNQQHALVTLISSETNQTLQDQIGVEFFHAMKNLTVTGYYKSAVGRTEELAENGELYFDDDPGCVHPEHQESATSPGDDPADININGAE